MAIHSSVLLGESHGQRSLVGYSPCGRKESGMNGVTWCGVCVYIYIYIYVYIYLPVQNSSLQRITETKALLSLHSPEEQFWRRPGLGLGSPDFWTTVSELGPQMAQGFWVTFGHTPNKNRPSAMGNKIILNLWLWKLELKPSSCPLLAVVS